MLGDTEADVILNDAQARLEVAKAKTKALIKEADSEIKNSASMEG
jgi:hypothetical protein